MFDKTKIAAQLGGYVMGTTGSVADEIASKARFYKHNVAARFVPVTDRQIATIPNGDLYISRKIDGEFNLLYFDATATPKSLFCNAPKGRGRYGLPVNAEIEATLEKAGVKKAFVVGELYIDRNGQRTRVHDLTSVTANPKNVEELKQVKFAVFDLMEVDGVYYGGKPYSEIYAKVVELFKSRNLARPVETIKANTVNAVIDLYNKWVQGEGSEGLVVREVRTRSTYKVKPVQTVDVAIVGFAEGSGELQGNLGAVLTALMRPDGTFQIVAKVGSGFSLEERTKLYAELGKEVVPSEYIDTTSDHKPFKMVKPARVIEIDYMDILPQNSAGDAIEKMVLSYSDAKGWEIRRELPLASLLFPRFIRFRCDKGINPTDLRIEQLADLVEIEETKTRADAVALPSSEILSREVYTKEMKGATLVRKVVLWKTNKSAVDKSYPEFVLFFSDFSPNREDMLSTEIRISNDEAQIRELYTQTLNENIKKGWQKAA